MHKKTIRDISDAVIAECVADDASTRVVASKQIPAGWRILDIGPQSIAALRQALANAQTIVWNGALGVAEMPPFAKGSQAIIATLVQRTQSGATTIIGGGDSAAAEAEHRAQICIWLSLV